MPNEFASGVVIDRQGYILTNYHVLGDPAQNRLPRLGQRRPFKASWRPRSKVKAADPWTDLAVLKIDADDLEPIVLGDAKDLQEGPDRRGPGQPLRDWPEDGQVSASWGIISNLLAAPAGSGGGQRIGGRARRRCTTTAA